MKQTDNQFGRRRPFQNFDSDSFSYIYIDKKGNRRELHDMHMAMELVEKEGGSLVVSKRSQMKKAM